MTAVEVLTDPEDAKKDVDKGRAMIARVIPDHVQPIYRKHWDNCYTARCALVQEGKTSERLGQLFTGLDRLVRALIVHELGTQSNFLPWD